MSRPTFRTDIPIAPLSTAQANQETLDRVRRLAANGLAEFSDAPRTAPRPWWENAPTLSETFATYPWLSYSVLPMLLSGIVPALLLAGRRRRARR